MSPRSPVPVSPAGLAEAAAAIIALFRPPDRPRTIPSEIPFQQPPPPFPSTPSSPRPAPQLTPPPRLKFAPLGIRPFLRRRYQRDDWIAPPRLCPAPCLQPCDEAVPVLIPQPELFSKNPPAAWGGGNPFFCWPKWLLSGPAGRWVGTSSLDQLTSLLEGEGCPRP